MHNCFFVQSEADTIIFSVYKVVRESGYTGPVVIDVTDTDIYVAAVFISKKLPGMLCITRKPETIISSDLVTDDMASSIVPLHCMTGYDANSSFYGKGKKSVYDLVMKSSVAQRQLSRCGDKLDIEDDVVEDLLEFTRHVIYGDRKSKTMAEEHAIKWKSMKNKSFYFSHQMRIAYANTVFVQTTHLETPSLINRTWLGIIGWSLKLALPMHLPAQNITEVSENNESDDDDGKDVDTQEEIQDSSEDDSEFFDSD